jgi:hypothetical protein
VGKKAKERQKELRTLEHSLLHELPEGHEVTKQRKTNNWAMNHKKPSLIKDRGTPEKLQIEEDEILTTEEKNKLFL